MEDNYSKQYFSSLDAIRFLAFVMVFLQHMIVPDIITNQNPSLARFYDTHLRIGVLGLDLYLVLSGFLITWIILEEYKFTSSFKLSFFWLKRCLRIWPVYFLLILIAYLLVGSLRKFSGLDVHDMPSYLSLLTFTFNFYIIKNGPFFLYFIVFLWSISVEEQLYLLWGIVFKWGKKLLPWLCVIMVVASIVFRICTLHTAYNVYFNTLSWCGNYALGALLAFFCMNKGKLFERLKALPRPVIICIYFVLILNIISYNTIYASAFMTVFQRLAGACFFAFVIFEQNFCDHRVFNFGKSERINYLGRVSYGLFCYHGLVILVLTRTLEHLDILNNVICVFIVSPVLIFAITLLISIGSYKYFEMPIMSLRNKIKRA